MFAKLRSFATKLITPTVLWPLGLFTISLIIAITNFEPGVWLTGWDTLHPEFDFSLNFQRMLFGAWREDQGLGAVAAHSHMSDLPRIALLWLFSWFMPLASVKFIYVLLCLLLGPLGIYFFTTKTVLPKHRYAPLLGFTSGMIYLCNLGTVQHFYVVFEMFAVQYAALGWLFWQASEFVQTGKIKKLLFFSVLVLLATPMAYASTLWFAFAFGLALYLLLFSFLSRSKTYFFRTVTVGLVLLAINSFWLFPNLYFLFSGASKAPQNSHINELFSSEAFLHNQAYGTLQHVPLLRNFLFNWTQYEASTNTFSPLLQPWITHLKNPLVSLIGYSIFLFSLAGGLIAVKQKNTVLISVIAVGLMSIFMVINANPPFEWFFTFLRNHSNLFEEGLRFPFTKFSLLLMFAMSALAAQALAYLLDFLQQKQYKIAQRPVLIGAIISVLLCFYFLPAFSGNLINKKMKNDIPAEYFELFTWFKTQPPQARVAQLPLQTNSGWDYYSWDYEGPGFIWFGITQPLLVRDFDRWNPQNETFYNQAAQALYSGTKDEFIAVLKQYSVSYLLVDRSIVSPGQENFSLAYDKIDGFLNNETTPIIWEKGSLQVYNVREITQAPSSYTQVTSSIPSISAETTYTRTNPIYSRNGSYISPIDESSTANFNYPFADLLTDREAQVVVTDSSIILERTLTHVDQNSESIDIVIPALTTKTPITTAFSVEYLDTVAVLTFLPSPEITINNQTIQHPVIEDTVTIPLEITPEELAIGFGTTLTNVKKGEKSSFIITTLAGNPTLRIFYSDPNGVGDESARLYEFQIPSMIWQSHFTDQVLSFPNPSGTASTIQLTYPTAAIPSYLFDTSSTKNCAQDAMGEFSQTNTDESIQLIASKKGAACKVLTFPQTTLNDSFIIRMQGKNELGRSLKYYIRNTITSHNELEHVLPEKTFDTSYSILRHTYANERDSFYNPYALTIETRSFGNRTSSNELTALALYPLPIEWLSTIYSSNPNSPKAELTQLTEPVTTQQLNTSQYDIRLSKSTIEQYLIFNQSIDGGWIAFPRLQPWKKLPHFSYNGWANAWQVPSNIQHITILFWPQLLSLLGYCLGILTLLILLPSIWGKQVLFTAKKITVNSRKIMIRARNLLEGSTK